MTKPSAEESPSLDMVVGIMNKRLVKVFTRGEYWSEVEPKGSLYWRVSFGASDMLTLPVLAAIGRMRDELKAAPGYCYACVEPCPDGVRFSVVVDAKK